MNNKTGVSTQQIVLAAILTAIVVILQFMGATIRLGPFSITLVLLPIVIGATMCSASVGAWLGLVFGVVVLITDSAAFMAVNPLGTILTVLAKGVCAGLVAGLTYKTLSRVNKYLAVAASAIACPIVNTGIFLIGCLLFFMDPIREWTMAAGLGGDVGKYMIFTLVGMNFIVELAVNMVLCPVIVRILNIRRG